MAKVEKVRIKMQSTIDSQAASLARQESDIKAYLTRILDQDAMLTALTSERDEALRQREEALRLQREADATRDELLRQLENRVKESVAQFTEGEKSMRGKIRLAWETAMPNYPFSWFERRLDWADMKISAEQAGAAPVSSFEDFNAELGGDYEFMDEAGEDEAGEGEAGEEAGGKDAEMPDAPNEGEASKDGDQAGPSK